MRLSSSGCFRKNMQPNQRSVSLQRWSHRTNMQPLCQRIPAESFPHSAMRQSVSDFDHPVCFLEPFLRSLRVSEVAYSSIIDRWVWFQKSRSWSKLCRLWRPWRRHHRRRAAVSKCTSFIIHFTSSHFFGSFNWYFLAVNTLWFLWKIFHAFLKCASCIIFQF